MWTSNIISSQLQLAAHWFSPGEMATPEGRAAERHRRALLSSLTAVAAKLISVLATLISVPLTLHYLGPERFGMWMTMSSFIAMLSFADLGMGNGLLNAVAQANGRGDRAAIRGLVSSAYVALAGVAVGIGAIAATVYPFVLWPRLFNVQSETAAHEAGPAMAVFLACFALNVPLGIVQKAQTGLQQGFRSGLWQGAASILSLAILLAAIRFEASLPFLVLALLGVPLAVNVANAAAFFGIAARDLFPSFHYVTWRDMSRIGRSGALFLVLQIVTAVAYSSDNLIITQILGSTRVSEFAVPAQMFGLVSTVLNIGLSPLWPAYGEAIARGDHDWVKRTIYRSIVLSVGLATIASAALVVAGPALLGLWVGKQINPALNLLLCLGVWKVLEAGGNSVSMFLNAAHIVSLQITLATLTGIVIVVTKIVFVGQIGVVGAPLASIVSFIVCSAVPIAFILPKIVRTHAPLESR